MPSVKASSADGTKKKHLSSLSSLQPMLKFPSLPPNTPHQTTKNIPIDRSDMPPPPPGVTGKRPRPPHAYLQRPLPDLDSSSRLTPVRARHTAVLVRENDEQSIRQKPAAVNGGMWADQYAPDSESDLAPGKQRLNKIKEWTHEALYGYPIGYIPPPGGLTDAQRDKLRRYRRVLLLTGPAGIGKTTSIRVIAKQMGVDLVEWGEGVEEWSLGGGIVRESPIAKVTAFLSRQSYTPLVMNGTSSSQSRPRMLLMTALPNLSHPPTRQSFHVALAAFCKNHSAASSPLVIIHSDGGSGGRAEESWMERDRAGLDGPVDIVGKDVLGSPYCTEIGFLSLAPTFMFKALNRVLSIAEYDHSLRPPAPAVQLIGLTSNGDLRSAINSLQLLCSRRLTPQASKRKKVDAGESTGKKGKGSRGGKGSKIEVSDDLRATLDAVTRREQGLGLFHALGKVLYNKRLSDPDVGKEDEELVTAVRALPQEDPLPRHLDHYQRSRSLVQIDAFLPSIPVDTSTFALWIHQNLPGFCSEMDQVAAITDLFCDADLMKTESDIWQSNPVAIAYALHLTVRSALLGLPSPAARTTHKLAKPQYFSALRSEKMNSGHLDTAAAYLGVRAVSSSNRLSEVMFETESEGAWGGLPSNRTLATELVPMLTKMQDMTQHALLPASVRSLSMPAYNTGKADLEEFGAADVIDPGCEDGERAHEGRLSQASGTQGGWDRCEEETGAADADLEEEIESWD